MKNQIRGGVFFGLLLGVAVSPIQAASATLHNGALSDALIRSAAAGALNNVVVDIQSIATLPEPRSIILLGTTLLIICGIFRRKYGRSGQSAS